MSSGVALGLFLAVLARPGDILVQSAASSQPASHARMHARTQQPASQPATHARTHARSHQTRAREAKSRAYAIQFARACRGDRARARARGVRGARARARDGATPKTRFRDPRPPTVCEHTSAAPYYKNRVSDLETPYRTKQYVNILPQKHKLPEIASPRAEAVHHGRCWTF